MIKATLFSVAYRKGNVLLRYSCVLFLITLLTSLSFTANSAELHDDFETGLGHWNNVSSDDNKDWTRDSNGTPSGSTGPSTGANSSNYYVYLETSSGAAYSSGDSAILQSGSITGENINLKFQYHMFGSNIGHLAVDVFSDNVWIYDVWGIFGQQHKSTQANYSEVEIDLSSYSVSKLRFRAEAIGGYRGDIALDNITITIPPTGPVAPLFTSTLLEKPQAYQDSLYTDSLIDDASDENGDNLTFDKVSGPVWLQVSKNGVLGGTPISSDVGTNVLL